MMSSLRLRQSLVLLLTVCLLIPLGQLALQACPFCAAPSRTLTEELVSSDIVVLAKLVTRGDVDANAVTTAADTRAESKFQVEKILKGGEHLKDKQVSAFFFGDAEPGTTFLMAAMVLPEIKWTTPIPLSERGEKYVSTLLSVPEKGPQRLAFFWNYLEDQDSLLAQDSYDEFARAPYADVMALKSEIDRPKLLTWINNPDIAQSRRRLYFTLLGVCGKQEDLPMLEGMMKSKDRRAKAGLDALIGCYLALRGADGMPLVEELFLKQKDAEYSDTYAAIMALRVMGQESQVIPRPRLLEGLHYMLQRPDLADLVIPDLARWEDWSIMDQMVQLFKDANPKSNFIRVPVINYLEAAVRQKGEIGEKASAAIDELAKIDPEAVKRAKAYAIFGPLATKKPAPPAEDNGAKTAAGESPEKPAPESAKPAAESAKPAAESAKPAAGKVPAPQPAAEKTSAPQPKKETSQREPGPGENTLELAITAAADSAAEDDLNLFGGPNETVAVIVEKSETAPSPAGVAATLAEASATESAAQGGGVVDLDRSFGGRLGLMLGMLVAMLVGLRVVSSRVGSTPE